MAPPLKNFSSDLHQNEKTALKNSAPPQKKPKDFPQKNLKKVPPPSRKTP